MRKEKTLNTIVFKVFICLSRMKKIFFQYGFELLRKTKIQLDNVNK